MKLGDVLSGLDVVVDTQDALVAMSAEAAFDPQRIYRYALTRIWDPAGELLPWVMLNPSTADAFRADPTVTRCVDFSRRWGYGGLGILNANALRSTDPRVLRDHPAPIGDLNDAVIWRVLLALPHQAPVMCAWGANVDPGRGRYLLDQIRDAGRVPMCLGRTRAGHPRHPLYVAGATTREVMP